MTSYIDPAFRESLLKKPHDRTAQDLTLINANLKSLEALSSLRDTTIRSLCKTVRYEKHEANDVLYRSDDVINCWYILLSGSVFIDGSMFLPRSGFGRRSVGQSRRIHDCLVLETSEMIVIDYPHLKQQTQIQVQPELAQQQQQQKSNQQQLSKSLSSTTNTSSNSFQTSTKLNDTNNLPNNQSELILSTTTTATSSSSSLSSSSILNNKSRTTTVTAPKLAAHFDDANNKHHSLYVNTTSNNNNNEEDDNDEDENTNDNIGLDDSLNTASNNNLNLTTGSSTYCFSPLHSSIVSSSQTNVNNEKSTSKKKMKSVNIVKQDDEQLKSICIITNPSSNPTSSTKLNSTSPKPLSIHINATNNTNIEDDEENSDLNNDQHHHNHHHHHHHHHSKKNKNKHKSATSRVHNNVSLQLNNTSINSTSSELANHQLHHHLLNSNQSASTNGSSLLIGDDVSSSDLHQSIHDIMNNKDIVRDVLEKDPKERTDEDIDILYEFMQSFPAFSELTPPIVRKLCACMVLGVVDKADTLVLDHHEKLDSWAVVLNGCVECTLPDKSVKQYNVGDQFGVGATLEPVYHEGVMRTKCDECQFVLVKQNDYYEILSKSKENLSSHTENGKLVLVTEQRLVNDSTDKTGEIVLKGSVEKLVERLVYDDSYSIIDPTYIQDFLLTYRVFCENPVRISSKLLEWFQQSNKQQNAQTASLKKKVYRIVLEWITNHFNDFETNKELYEFVERFLEQLNKEKMSEQFRVLTIAVSTKSKTRTVTLARSKRDETLMFSIQGGWEKGYGIFVSKVEKDTKAHELGIRKGDQILDVNGHSFQHITLLNALDTLKSFTHLSISLKYNPIGFNEMLLHPEKSPHRNKKTIVNNDKQYLMKYLQMQQTQFQRELNSVDADSTAKVNTQQTQPKKSIGTIPPLPPSSQLVQHSPSSNTKRDQTSKLQLAPKESTSSSNQIKKLWGRFNRKAHSKDLESLHVEASAPSLKSITRSPSPSLSSFQSTSNMFNRSTTITSITSQTSDYSSNILRNNSLTNLNTSNESARTANNMSTSLVSLSLQDQQQFVGEHVLKIYKNDQTFKYLVVHKETSTKEVVMLALNEFNIVDEMGSNAYSLCEVSVDQDRLIKQKRLPDQMNNLADKLPLNARYYLKSNTSPEQFLSDQMSVEELISNSNIAFLQLDPLELSAQLTLRDYCIFKSIESSEYIDYFFKKESKYGYAHLTQFADLSNEEMFWVVNEILHESNLVKRAKIIKLFIQIAHICKECKNFNSLLAILSGLDHLTVIRLKETWEKVPAKYKKILDELRNLLDTTRNMLKYRQLLKSEYIQPPIIPFYPICQKDLYFIKESGDTREDELINFDKLRKFSKGVRSIVQLTSSSFDLTSLKEVPTSYSAIFTMFGCTSPHLIESIKSTGYQFTKLNIKADHLKKLYEESVMVRKVRHYLNNLSKNIEKNEERLRMISAALEHSVSVNTTLRRKPSPNSSLGGSVSSINGLNNSANLHNLSNGSTIGASTTLAGISSGNGVLNSNGKINAASLFGAHSPDRVKKLLSLSETKQVKTVKPSASSSNVPISHFSNSRLLLNTSGNSTHGCVSSGGSGNTHNTSNISITSTGNYLPNENSTNVNILSPKSKHRSVSSSQPITTNLTTNNTQKQNNTYSSIPLSSESSSVSTIKLTGKLIVDSSTAYSSTPSTNIMSANYANTSKSKSTIHITNTNVTVTGGVGTAAVVSSEADSGRASMASNIDQDQCSPTFQPRAFTINRYILSEQPSQHYMAKTTTTKFQVSNNGGQPGSPNMSQYVLKQQHNFNQNEMFIKNSTNAIMNKNLLPQNPQNSLEEEEDQVSAV